MTAQTRAPHAPFAEPFPSIKPSPSCLLFSRPVSYYTPPVPVPGAIAGSVPFFPPLAPTQGHGQRMSHRAAQAPPMNAARYFIRREDNEPPAPRQRAPSAASTPSASSAAPTISVWPAPSMKPPANRDSWTPARAVGRPSLLNCVETSSARPLSLGARQPLDFGETPRSSRL